MRARAGVALVMLLIGASCSRGDDGDAGGATTTVVVRPDVEPSTTPAVPAGSGSTVDVTPSPSSADEAPPTTVELAAVPEVGVPGLDSDDAFCAAWSRWAGSYQVLLVANAFGTGGPDVLASLEVVAAPVLVAASGAMVAAWPDSIADERDVAADALLGPITRRLTVALDALVQAGADDEMLTVIEDAWLGALAERDPAVADFSVELPDEVWAVVDAAALDFSAELVPFAVDPTLVTEVETPLTDSYLAVSCPDRGTLSGQEVDPDATTP